jgi:hypothetical protein
MMALDEKISTLQFRELLNQVLESLKSIKKRITTGELTGQAYNKTAPHTSHFYFMPSYEKFIKTLELNFFITKYNEMSDRDAVKSSVYSLNYGLCVKNNLRWGKPEDQRKYFIERPFNFNRLIDEFLKQSKKIVCLNPNCNKTYSIEQLPFLEFNKMRCPECQCIVKTVSISGNIQSDIEKIDASKLLHPIEYSILHELNKSEHPLRPKEIAEELDCSHQLIGKKAKILDEDKKLLKRVLDGNGNRVYRITAKALDTYFA